MYLAGECTRSSSELFFFNVKLNYRRWQFFCLHMLHDDSPSWSAPNANVMLVFLVICDITWYMWWAGVICVNRNANPCVMRNEHTFIFTEEKTKTSSIPDNKLEHIINETITAAAIDKQHSKKCDTRQFKKRRKKTSDRQPSSGAW